MILNAAGDPAVAASIIAAASGIITTGLLIWAQLTRSSWTNLLEELADKIIEKLSSEIKETLDQRTRAIYFGNIVRRVLREVLDDEMGRYFSAERRRRKFLDDDTDDE